MLKKHIVFECDCKTSGGECSKTKKVRIEILNALTGFGLLIAAAQVYFLSGFEMMMSWGIFGAMYLAMDKYEEDCMGADEINSGWHLVRRFFAWVGVLAVFVLVGYYANNLLAA